MSLEKELQDFISTKYKSIRQFSTNIGIPYTTIKGGLERGIMGMSVQNVVKMCRALCIDVEALANGEIKPIGSSKVSLSNNEQKLLNNYSELNDNAKSNLLDYSNYIASKPENRKNNPKTDKMNA